MMLAPLVASAAGAKPLTPTDLQGLETTLAEIVASESDSRFVKFSAVTAGSREGKEGMNEAARLRRAAGTRTLLFVAGITEKMKLGQTVLIMG